MAPQAAAPLVGRDADVAALGAAADEARAGTTRCVLVTGEAGIGKTRLVSEALAGLEDACVLVGQAADMSTGEIPFGVVADTLRDLLHRYGDQALAPSERGALSQLLPGDSEHPRADPTRILAAALDLLARLSRERLLVWVVEDLQWTDAATRDLVNLAVRTVRGRLLVVVTLRTGDPGPASPGDAGLAEYVASLARVPHARRLDLGRLTDEQVHALVRSLADGLSPERLRSVIRLGDGIPFAVEELVAAGGRWGEGSLAAARRARVARLGVSARRLAEAAAVGEGHLRISLVEQVLDVGVDELDAALAEAVEAGVLACDYPADRLGFRHALLRRTVDDATAPGARRRWHRRWAEVLEANPGVLAVDPAAVAVAEHWHRAGDPGRSVAAAYAAVPAALRTSPHDLTVRLWQRVLDGWEARDPDSAAGDLTLRAVVGEAVSIVWTVNDERVVDDLLDAARRHPLDPATAAVLAFVAVTQQETKISARRTDDAAVRLADACDWLAEPPDKLTESALSILGGFLPTSEGARADGYLRRRESLARRSGQDRPPGLVKARVSRLAAAGDIVGAIGELERALERLPRDEVSDRLGFAGDLAWCHLRAGRHADADRVVTEQLETTPHLESMPSLWEHVVENAVFGWLCTGQWQRARRVVEGAAAWWPDDLRLASWELARLDLLERGRTDERRWRAHLGSVIIGGPSDIALRVLLAGAAGRRGDLAGMRSTVAPVWALDRISADEGIWRDVVDLARLEADAAFPDPAPSDRSDALAHLGLMSAHLAAAPQGEPHVGAALLELDAQAERLRGRDPRAALERALATWAALDHVPDVAVTHLYLAEAHAEAGDRDAAREHLAAGSGLAGELGAEPWQARARTIARHYGFASRAQRPEDVLTGREAEVLGLLAEGRTNKEIAGILCIAPKTASVHVSRIIAKLRASNRTEAVAVARRRGLVGTVGS